MPKEELSKILSCGHSTTDSISIIRVLSDQKPDYGCQPERILFNLYAAKASRHIMEKLP
jgi:hypothetical protein